MKKIILQLIRFYQRTLSPDHGPMNNISAMRCRFYPSCSEYGYQSIERYGVIRGSSKTVVRILRCNPLSRGGIDYPVKRII